MLVTLIMKKNGTILTFCNSRFNKDKWLVVMIGSTSGEHYIKCVFSKSFVWCGLLVYSAASWVLQHINYI